MRYRGAESLICLPGARGVAPFLVLERARWHAACFEVPRWAFITVPARCDQQRETDHRASAPRKSVPHVPRNVPCWGSCHSQRLNASCLNR